MTLEDIVGLIDTLDDEHVICLRPPWEAESSALVTALEPGRRLPDTVVGTGFEYFLEVGVARAVLYVLEGRRLTPETQLKSLVYYAVHHVLPSWLYAGRESRAS
jgi:hypothetical protein